MIKETILYGLAVIGTITIFMIAMSWAFGAFDKSKAKVKG